MRNMVVVVSRYECGTGKIGTACASHIGTPCAVQLANEDHTLVDEPCIMVCASGVPWRRPCPNNWGVCEPQTRDVKCLGNTLTIGKRCEADGVTLKTLIHEFGHVLGLYHEMNRGDRSQFIDILDGRLQKGREINFEIPRTKPDILDTPYDYLSIMHYSQYAFTKKRDCVTIQTKSKCAQRVIGHSKLASFHDVKAVNTMYRCNIHCRQENYETWKENGYGPCGVQPNCYLNGACECICPEKWQNDLRYLPRSHELHQFLPDDDDCHLGAAATNCNLHLLVTCLILAWWKDCYLEKMN